MSNSYIKEVDLLEYRLDDEELGYPTFYHLKGIPPAEIHARKMCDYFIYEGTVFESSFTALEDECHVIYVKKHATEEAFEFGITYNELGIEVRKFVSGSDVRELIHFFPCHSHSDVLSFTTSNIIYIEGKELQVLSLELDQDRMIYAMYVRPTK